MQMLTLLLSRRILVTLTEASYVVKIISPILLLLCLLSKTNQTGTTCELPSILTVASFPVNVPFIRNLAISAVDISAIIVGNVLF